MSTAHNCAICGYPIAPAGVSWGYAGPTCQGHPMLGSYTFTPTPLTADEVRRIVREEIERAAVKAELVQP